MMPTDQPPQESQHGPRASRTWSITVPSAIRLLVIASMVAASLVALLTVDTSTARGGTITNVKATDVRDTSFVVSWTSATAEVGSVAYGVAVSGSCTNATLGSVAQDKRGPSYASLVHYVPISNIDPNLGKTICYRVTSGATQDAAQMVTLGATTGMVAPDTIYGVVMNGSQPVTDAIAYFTITENSATSAPFSVAITSTDGGYYQVSLSGARSADGTLVFGYSDAGSLSLTVVAGPGSPTSFQTTVGAARAASCPGCSGLPAITLTGTGATPTAIPSATATATPSATGTALPTATATRISSATATSTALSTASSTPTSASSTATATSTATASPTPPPDGTSVTLKFSPSNVAVSPGNTVSIALQAVVAPALSFDSWLIRISYDKSVIVFSETGCVLGSGTTFCELDTTGQGAVVINGLGTPLTNTTSTLATLTFTAVGTEGASSDLVIASNSELGIIATAASVAWTQVGVSKVMVNSVPVINSVNPISAWGGGGKTITIYGSNFVNGATVKVGARFATSVAVVDSTTITAIAPPAVVFGDVTGDGQVKLVDAICVLRKASNLTAVANCPADKITLATSITVTNPGGQAATNDNAFTYQMADVTNDGAVKLVDAICVLRRASNLSAVANCPTPVAYIAPASVH